MDAKKIKIDETPVEKAHIPFLPDELLLRIFSNISELKTLFHCSLVSKRFASLVYQVRDISAKLPANTIQYPTDYINRVSYTFRGRTTPFRSNELPKFPEQSVHKLDPPIFLKNFLELESIYLEYSLDDNSSPFKWRVNFGSSNSILESFVVIIPDSVHKKTDYVPDRDLKNYSPPRFPQFPDCFSVSYERYMEWLYLICMLLKCHAKLRCVTVTDSLKQGKLVVKDEQLLKIRGCFINKEGGINYRRDVLKLYHARELHLRVSGYVMIGCTMATKFTREENAIGEDDEAWQFDEDEKVFEEAVKEILNRGSVRLMRTIIG